MLAIHVFESAAEVTETMQIVFGLNNTHETLASADQEIVQLKETLKREPVKDYVLLVRAVEDEVTVREERIIVNPTGDANPWTDA